MSNYNYSKEISGKVRWQIAVAQLRLQELHGEKNRRERERVSRWLNSKKRLLLQIENQPARQSV